MDGLERYDCPGLTFGAPIGWFRGCREAGILLSTIILPPRPTRRRIATAERPDLGGAVGGGLGDVDDDEEDEADEKVKGDSWSEEGSDSEIDWKCLRDRGVGSGW